MYVVITPRQLNSFNKKFWKKQNALMNRRLKRRELVMAAAQFLADEARRHVPMGYRRSFETALADAEQAALILATEGTVGDAFAISILAASARKAGSARKIDDLGKLIEQLVARQPTMSVQELTAILDQQKGIGLIQDVDDGGIWFTNKGKWSKRVPLSGLRSRLSRAKAQFRRSQSR
jgi:septum formation inhibitor-activating ATPase MinD